MGIRVVGYITSDTFLSGFISHQVQNASIKQYTEEEGHKYLLSWTEYINKAPIVLNSLLQESFFDGICFYSLEQLNHIKNAQKLLKELAKKDYWIGFAKEKQCFKGYDNLESILYIR